MAYDEFRYVLGSSSAQRFELLRFPGCVLTAPKDPACAAYEVVGEVVNDVDRGVLTAVIPADVADSDRRSPLRSVIDEWKEPVGDPKDLAVKGAASHPALLPASEVEVVPSGPGAGRVVRRRRSSGSGVTVYGLGNGYSSTLGSFNATPMSSSGSWNVGLQQGSFDYRYDVPVPPSGFGMSPNVGVSFSSSAVDGFVSDENTQEGNFGAGWGLDAGGFIERTYTPCIKDGGSIQDFCWYRDNATISLNGHSSELISDGSPNSTWSTWHLKDDPGWIVYRQRDFYTNNSVDEQGEIWYVISPDGTIYKFGQRFEGPSQTYDTNSVWTVPVYGNHSGEPCFGSWCMQAWRWNLDQIQDTNGNITTFKYGLESNWYGRGGAPAAQTLYQRGGYLSEIHYGATASAPLEFRNKVVLTMKERCTSTDPAANCEWSGGTTTPVYPDTPFTLACTTAAACYKYAPSFWTQLTLDNITTYVNDASAEWSPNLIANGDFETGTTGWVKIDPSGGTTNFVTYASTTGAQAGGNYAEANSSPAGGSIYRDGAVAVQANKTYVLTAWVRSPSGSPVAGRLALWALGATSQSVSVNIVADGTWRQVVVPFTPTAAGNTALRAQLYIDTASANIDLDSVTVNGTDWRAVDTVTPTTSWPDGDGAGAMPPRLYLNALVRTGAPGNTNAIALPAVTFDSTAYLDNRADGITMSYYRITDVNNELGGKTTVAYFQQNLCTRWSWTDPDWDNNDQDCFVRWTVNGSSAGYGAFNKFLVDSVTQYDIAIPAPENWMSIPIVTEYDYIGTPTAHYDEFIYLNLSHKTWSEPRGYGEVVVHTGTGSTSTEMATRHRFFRGMHGDNNGTGGTKSVPLPMDDGTTVNDDSWLRGRQYDTEVLDAGSSNVVMERDNWYFVGAATATWNTQTAYRVDTVRARHWSQEGTGYYQTQVQTSYDSYGLPIQMWDEGDVTTTADDTCTSRQYVRTSTATNAWMLDRVTRPGKAGGTPSNPGGDFGNCVESAELSLVENFYDAQTFGSALSTGRLTSSNSRATISSSARTTSFTYDTAGRVTQIDGRRIDVTDVTTTTYDSAGFPTRIVDATGHAVTTRVDRGTGNTLATIDENNTTANGDGTDSNIYYQYDALGRAIAMFTPDNGSYNAPAVKNTYSLDSLKVAAPKVRTDTNQSAGVDLTVFTYFDGLGRQRETQRTSPAGGRIISATQYDGAGLAVRTFTDQYQNLAVDSNMWTAGPIFDGRYLDSETVTTFDHLARPTATTRWGKTGTFNPVTDPAIVVVNGVNVSTAYAYSGHTTTVTPPGSSATATHTNALGQTDTLSEYNTTWTGAKVTTYGYNLNRQQTSVTDPLGNITSTVYDNWGRVTDTYDPDRGHTALTYFDDGTPNTATHAVGTGTARTITYTTDALGRVTTVANGATALERYAWDATGEAGMSDYSESVFSGANIRVDTLGYDARSRPLGTSYIIPSITGWTSTNGLAGTYTYNNVTYDRADHATSYTSAALGGLTSETLTASYTTLGMPNALTGAAAYVTGSTYNGQGRIANRTLSTTGANVVRNYVWDLQNARLDSINALQGATILLNDVQLYNADGTLRGSIHDRVGTASDHGECYFYDGRQRLTAAYTNNTTTTTKDCSYASTGGLTPYNQTYTYNEIGNLTASPAGTYTYPASGSSSVRPHAATTVGSTTLTYNNDGTRATSTTSGTGTSYAWDPLEHLASTTTSGSATSMAYLPGGQRVLLKDSNGVALYLGNFAERQAATGGVKTEKRYFTIGSNTVAIKTRPSNTGVTTTDYLIGDIRGSVTLTIPRAGGATSERWYQPYGDQRGSATTGATNRAYIGQYQDATRLIYLNNRYYDPTIGLFVSVDPLVASTGDPYLYAAGNPTTLSDPLGLCANTPEEAAACFGAPAVVAGAYQKAAAGWSQTEIMTNLLDQPAFVGPRGGRLGAEGDALSLATDAALTPTYQIFTFLTTADALSYLAQLADSTVESAFNSITKTVAVFQGRGKGKTVVEVTTYVNGIDDLKDLLPRNAGVLEMQVARVGRVFLAADIAFTGWEAWSETEGKPAFYRVGYTVAETTLVVGAAAAGGAAGSKWGVEACGFYCGVIGGFGGAVLGGIAADRATDWYVELVD